ncbi:hypothetical protein AALP_AA4G095000 [Arabis alpina]|uniref:Uncharacterized protein n=1 Tax=Arabis alpina TaxID=50452 RepID=A0A087H277_ARAAL|nr:hypothetical protein AALP_AA4G095000 [Arabis alpina]
MVSTSSPTNAAMLNNLKARCKGKIGSGKRDSSRNPAVSGSYLVVVTENESVASFLGHPIFKINSLKLLPCDHSLKNSPGEQVTPVFRFPLVYVTMSSKQQWS